MVSNHLKSSREDDAAYIYIERKCYKILCILYSMKKSEVLAKVKNLDGQLPRQGLSNPIPIICTTVGIITIRMTIMCAAMSLLSLQNRKD